MSDVAELGVRLTSDGSEQVVSALNRVERAVQGTHQSTLAMGAAIGVASSVASAAFGVISNAAGAALSGVQGATIGMNASLEQATIGFTTLLKSADAAQAFLKELQQFAQSTPFEFKDLIPQAQRLQAMGFAAKDVIPILRDVGNVTAAMGSGKEGIDRVTLALGQMHSATVVHAQDVNQLIQAGVPAWELLAQATGKSTAEVRQLSEAGKISADVFIAAFRAWSQNNVGTMMEAQSRTFIGAVSNIKDALGIAVAQGFKPLFDTVRDLAVTFGDFVQSETFGVWATDLKITFGQLMPTIKGLSDWLMGQLPAAMSAAEAGAHAFVAVVQDIGPKIADLAQNVGPVLAATWEKLGAVLSPVGAALAAIGAPLATVYGAFAQLDELINGTLGAALSGLGGQLADDSRNLINIGAALSTALGGSQTAALDALAVTAARVGDALSALGTIASTAFQDMQIVVVNAWNVIIPKLEEARGWLETNLAPALATLQESWDGFWSHAGPVVQAMWNVVQPILGAAIGIEIGILQKILETFKGVWDFVWGGIQTALEKVAPLIGALASTFGGAFAGLSDTITAALNSMQTPVAEAAGEVGTVIKNNIVAGVAPVGAEIAAATEPAAAAVAKVGASAATAGAAVASLGSAGQTAAAGLSATSDAADKAAKKIAEAEAKGLGGFTDDAGIARTRQVLGQLTADLDPAMQGWVKYMEATDQAGAALTTVASQMGLDSEMMRAAWDGDKLALAELNDQLERNKKNELELSGAADFQIDKLVNSALATKAYQAATKGLADDQKAYYDAVQRVLGAETALARLRDAQAAQGGTSGLSFSTGTLGGALSGPVVGFGSVGSSTTAAVVNPYQTGATMAQGFRENVGSGPFEFGVHIGDGFAAVGRQFVGEMTAAQQKEYQTQNLFATLIQGHGEAVARELMGAIASGEIKVDQDFLRNQAATAAAQHAWDTRHSDITDAGIDVTQRDPYDLGGLYHPYDTSNPPGILKQTYAGGGGIGAIPGGGDTLTGGLGAVAGGARDATRAVDGLTASYWGIGSAAQRVADQTSGAMAYMTQAIDQTAAAARQAWAAALQAGSIMIAGMKTQIGLTYGQIYSQTATQGTGSTGLVGTLGTPGAYQNLPPGNYGGIPVVEKLTAGTLRGYAEGGWVTEPVVGRGMRSGASYAFGERGPEYVSPGGGSGSNVTIVIQARDAAVMRDRAFWEQVVDGSLRPVLKERGFVTR